MLAQLIPSDGGKPITLDRNITVVGRKDGLCDLTFDSNSISKTHCVLVKTDGLLFIRDLGSTNGTRVNGQRVTRGALLPGDLLSFSGITFRVHLGPDGPGRAAPLGGPTEMIPAIGDSSEEFQLPGQPESSHSDVRMLSDSDYLPPD